MPDQAPAISGKGHTRTGRTSPHRLTPVLASALFVFAAGCHHERQLSARQHLDFNQDVQPILASNCFSCHGPDPEMRKAGLRLDIEEYAMRKRPGHPDAIVPGHPEKSELIRRIESRNPHYLMPQSPQGEAKPMKSADIATLKEWIREGAVYRPHWAFEAPARPAIPVSAESWGTNPIDAFVLARMKKEGLDPSPEADKATLIRRATLDLTGLLPTPAEVWAFVNDPSPQAYEHLVDGLLARPTFGEQRARYWLDYARYSDTYGLHYDNSRDIWPWRDYVIRSFNANKPFDQFAMEQIAGDLMPARNLDPLIGSGYVRLGVSSNEGGTIPEELRVNIARERTEAYGATFMGLTVGCAVCHDHKFDPTTQNDFYALSAFFNNIDEKPFNGDRPVWAPVARVPKAANADAYDRVLAERTDLQMKLNAMSASQRTLVLDWLASGQSPPERVATGKLVLRLRMDEAGGDTLKNSAPNASPESYPITGGKPEWGETTWLWPDLRMQPSTRVVLGQTGDFDTGQAFSLGGWMMLRTAPNYAIDGATGTLISKMDSAQHRRGWEIAMVKGHLIVGLVNEEPKDSGKPEKERKEEPKFKEPFQYPTPADLTAKDLAPYKPPQTAEDKKKEAEDKKKAAEEEKKKKAEEAKKPAEPPDTTPTVAIRVASVDRLPLDGYWKHLFFTYDGSGKASGVKIYLNGAPLATHVVSDSLDGKTIRTPAPMQLGWRDPADNPAKETRYQDIRLYARTLSADETKRLPFEDYAAEISAQPKARWTADQWHVLGQYYLNAVDKTWRDGQARIRTLDAQLEKLSEGGDLTLVAWEKPGIAYANVLTRGAYSARVERVEANTPHFLPPLPQGVPHNRLALARWTVSPENPLTARVTVNRMWYELFGTGLVETTEDFGIMGQRPSHPELLDWLAVEFRESGWNIKHMYKLIVMSATYRQSAKSTPEQLAKDPRNLLLSHGPRYRMDAEMLRDVALQSGGLLEPKIGGPSVKPYQPANVWEQIGIGGSDTLHYVRDHGGALYRRSMYSYWKRMAPLPDMDAFDAQMRDVVCTRRQRTDTPLQALVTMNDVQWVEAARALAQRAILEGGSGPEQRIDLMSEILLAHNPPPNMEAVLEASLAEMRQHYDADPKAAHALISEGEKKASPSIPEPELAAWTMVASEMLNLDETITK
jgi:hypothetical protein